MTSDPKAPTAENDLLSEEDLEAVNGGSLLGLGSKLGSSLSAKKGASQSSAVSQGPGGASGDLGPKSPIQR